MKERRLKKCQSINQFLDYFPKLNYILLMNGYRNLEIVEKKEWENGYFSFFFEDKDIADKVFPGNFFMIKTKHPENGVILPRPFSIARVFAEKGVFEIFFQVVGRGTENFSRLKEGDEIEILGPLGNKFPFETNKKIIMIGGGRGISPFLYLVKILKERGKEYKLIYGGKSIKDIKFRSYLSEFNTTFVTEDGSFGERGLVTDYLPTGDFLILSCGPEIMMEKIFEFYRATESDVFVSLEERMACGTGICYGCAKRIKRNGKVEMVRVCQEGPVFKAEEVFWNEQD